MLSQVLTCKIIVVFRPERGATHYMNYLGNKSQSQRTPPEICQNREVPETTKTPALLQPPHNPLTALPPPPASAARKDHPVNETSQSSQKASTSPVPALSGDPKASSNSHSKSSSREKSPSHHSVLSKQKPAHKEEKHQPQPKSSDREHISSHSSKDCSGSEKRGCKPEQSTERSHPSLCKNKNYSNNKDQHRSHELKNPSDKQDSKCITSTEKNRNHERRQNTAKLSTTDSEGHADRNCQKSYSRAGIKCKCHKQRIRSSNIKEYKNLSLKQHCVCLSDCSKERKGDRSSKSEPRKEDRLRPEKPNRRSKRSMSSERSRDCAKHSSKNRNHCNPVQNVLNDAANIPEKKSAKESSPHMKLCFMERLNLTQSPIKKPALPGDSTYVSVDMLTEEELSGQEGSEPDMENMHIIDEVSGSELEAGSEDAVEQPQKSKEAQSERCKEDTCVQPEDHNSGGSIVSDQLLEKHLLQTVPAYVQPIRIEEDPKSVCVTHTSPDSSYFQAESRGIDEGYVEMTSNSHIGKSESIQPTASITDCSSAPKNTSGNILDSSVIIREANVTDSSQKQTCSSKITASQLKKMSSIHNAPDPPCLQSQEPHPPAICSAQEKDLEVVSSTISLESVPQEGLSLPDAIYMLTRTDEAAGDVVSTTNEAGLLTDCDAVAKISSTSQEVILPDTDGEPSVTLEKSFSSGKGHQNNIEPASSKPFLHDEDSMMHILSNLRMIPDPISPLRSPIQTFKRSNACTQSKPRHVKSLEKGTFCLVLLFP